MSLSGQNRGGQKNFNISEPQQKFPHPILSHDGPAQVSGVGLNPRSIPSLGNLTGRLTPGLPMGSLAKTQSMQEWCKTRPGRLTSHCCHPTGLQLHARVMEKEPQGREPSCGLGTVLSKWFAFYLHLLVDVGGDLARVPSPWPQTQPSRAEVQKVEPWDLPWNPSPQPKISAP